MTIISIILLVVKWIMVLYIVVLMPLACIMAVYQESKIWKPKLLPTLNGIGMIKVFLFNALWMFLCLLGSILMIIQYIITFGTADLGHTGNCIVERYVSKCCMKVFVGTVHVVGWENLPPKENVIPAPIYIANHSSQLDIGSVYTINRRFKWIAKESVLFLPGVGILMYLGNHVLIKRFGKHSKSVKNLFHMSDDAIQSGIPMFLFPQGTRRIANKLPFKSGAFVMATTNKTPLVPISIEIPTDTNPWNSSYPFNLLLGGTTPTVKFTIHKMVPIKGDEDLQVLSEQCTKTIYSILPPVYQHETEKDK